MSCYAIGRRKHVWERTVILVFPNAMMRSTFLENTVDYKDRYKECSAKEAYKYLYGGESPYSEVFHMQIPEY